MASGVEIVSGETLAISSTGSLTIDAGVTLYIDSGGTVTISNTGGSSIGINNLGGIVNSGTVTISNSGLALPHSSDGILNSGLIENNAPSGTVNIETGGNTCSPGFTGCVSDKGISNIGTMTNSGTINVKNSELSEGIDNGGQINGEFLSTTGTITNSGTITVETNGPFYGIDNDAGSTLSNSGTIKLSPVGVTYAGLENKGYFTNAGTGTIDAENAGPVGSGFNNNYNAGSGSFANSGVIYLRNTRGTGLYNAAGMDNFGNIYVENSASGALGLFNGHSIYLTNECGATISISSTAVFENQGTVTNSGTVIGTIINTYNGQVATGPSCTLSITPSQGPTGVSATLSGGGYGSTHTYNFCYEPATSLATACPGTLHFTASGAGSIPAGQAVTTSGSSNGLVVVSDPGTDAVITSATFAVTTPSIGLNPNSGQVGASVTVTGSGFSVDTAIGALTYAGSTPATQTCTSQTTSATGTFTCTFTVPPSSGSNEVVASGSDVGVVTADTASATFMASHPTTTTISPNPSTAVIGNSVIYTVTVTDTSSSPATPAGSVAWSDGGAGGSFSSATCTLSPLNASTSTCSVAYTPSSSPGAVTITGTYSGDSTHSVSSASALLTVQTPQQAIESLIRLKESMNLPQGLATSLDAKLNTALSSVNSGNYNAAMNQLNAFINEVNAQAGKHISASDAAQLVSGAQPIISALSS